MTNGLNNAILYKLKLYDSVNIVHPTSIVGMANTTSSENNIFPHAHTSIEALISPSTLPQTTSLRAVYGLSSLANYIKIKDEPTETQSPPARAPRKVTVGILGAGAAGLYTAMIINSFNDPHISCEILESNRGSEAVPPRRGGGRLYTYHFDGGKKNDYFVCIFQDLCVDSKTYQDI